MSRRIVDGALDTEACAAVREIIDRCAVAKPLEELPDTQLGISDADLSAADATGGASRLTLADTLRLEAIRELLHAQVCKFATLDPDGLVTDYTHFKKAWAGHRKSPHHDTHGFPDRRYSAILYLSENDTGAIAFGRLRPGEFIPEQQIAPAPGRLLLFDDSPSNAHAVLGLQSGQRYSVMSWFRRAEQDVPPNDWLARYLFFRPQLRLRLTAADLSTTPTDDGAHWLSGLGADGPFEAVIEARHLGALQRIVAWGRFSLDMLSAGAADETKRSSLELVSLLVRGSGLAQEA